MVTTHILICLTLRFFISFITYKSISLPILDTERGLNKNAWPSKSHSLHPSGPFKCLCSSSLDFKFLGIFKHTYKMIQFHTCSQDPFSFLSLQYHHHYCSERFFFLDNGFQNANNYYFKQKNTPHESKKNVYHQQIVAQTLTTLNKCLLSEKSFK